MGEPTMPSLLSRYRSVYRRTDRVSRRRRRLCPTLEVLDDRAVPSVYHVTNIADSGPGSLRDAVAAANAHTGADVVVFDSSLSGQVIALAGNEIQITDDLKINGPSSLTVTGDGQSRVFEIDAPATVTISGLTISGGDGVANPADTGLNAGQGGGILSFGSLTVNACTVSGNTAIAGGGIFNYLGALAVKGSSVSGNSAFGAAGIDTFHGTLQINDSTLADNSAPLGLGGAIYNDDSAVTISGSTLADNSANTGGGVYNHGGISDVGTLTMNGCSVVGNTAAAITDASGRFVRGGVGGGIFNEGGFQTMVTINGSTFTGNKALAKSAFFGLFIDGGRGGAIYDDGPLTVRGSTLSNNTAEVGGGAIESDGTLAVNDCTLTANSTLGFNGFAGNGGAIQILGGSATVADSTITGNTAIYFGGGIFNAGTLTMSNSTVSGNSAFGFPTNPTTGVGGGIFNFFFSTATLNGCTVEGNSAAFDGGGIYNDDFGTVNLSNCVVRLNTPDAIVGGFNDLGGNQVS
jgi:predicted outer membrane repeat protein